MNMSKNELTKGFYEKSEKKRWRMGRKSQKIQPARDTLTAVRRGGKGW